MDPTTLLILLLFLRRRGGKGHELNELLLPIILLSSAGQGAWQTPTAAPPFPSPPTVLPPGYTPTPAPSFANLLPLLLLLCGGDFNLSGGYKDID